MLHTKKFRYTDETKSRDIKTIEKPAISVSVLIFSIYKDKMETILVQRVRDPFKGFWSIPGDLTYIDETLEEAALRVLYEKTGIKDISLRQVRAFSEVKRDPRGRVITIGYFALLLYDSVDLSQSPNALHTSWIPINNLPSLAFDHKKIIDLTIQRIKEEIEYTKLAKDFLPQIFRLYDLQKVYEIVRGSKLDKRNFRKKILASGLIVPTDSFYKSGNHRPAKLYKFKK